jgi:hypothetical protein
LSITEIRKKAAGLLRALALLTVVMTAGSFFAARQLRASWGERLVGFGLELKRWEGIRLSTSPRRLFLNGAQLELASASSSLPVADVLDRLERTCDANGHVVGAERAQQLLRAPGPRGARLKPWLREETSERGLVACFDFGGPATLSGLTARLAAFARSGDLADVGKFRYVLAERHGEQTSVLFLWADGALPLRQMFPAAGDAPGRDPVGVPRLIGGRRLLAAAEDGTPYGFTAYQVAETSPEVALVAYRNALASRGFALSDLGHDTFLAQQGDRALLFHAATARRGVAVSVSELR